MSAKKLSDNLPADALGALARLAGVMAKRAGKRTWIEIDSNAAKKNYKIFRGLLSPKTKLWAVVKSNAYGHGLVVFSKLAEKLGVDGFCVDSLVEGLRLRKEGIKKSILVLGPTLPALFSEAVRQNIIITIANKESLLSLAGEKNPPQFHLKIDTGMHRQGFYSEDVPKVIKFIRNSKLEIRNSFRGFYTHFSSAKDINYPTYTEIQFKNFERAATAFKKAGFNKLTRHCAATGAALIDKKYHLDAVRIGIGLYGCWPSKELEIQIPKIHLEPVLGWQTVISDVKYIKAGEYVGYDLADRVFKDSRIAILPVGYWHGFPRSLSGVGEVLVSGRRVRVLGRVSMDLTIIDVQDIKCDIGDVVTLIGKNIKEEISAFEIAQKAGTVHYELLTRLNPLMERVLT